jgi:hypothetical protein
MDNDLRRRYFALFSQYAPQNTDVTEIKRLVTAQAERHHTHLREDAMYFLVLNFAEMILRAYTERIPFATDLPDPNSPRTLGPYKGSTPTDMMGNIDHALGILMSDVASTGDAEGVSAHQVIRVIDRHWEQLAVLFGWG